ncbi:EF-hand calcium-binding domain-containing protein [Paragonimus westermani]|uniref:EF-hand calcium-binding domain-containing protein n=1 Tax=Paragonimus westermani TaxID=34504 RepID=A0A8T0DNM1_9TREM|nr:EF-hand calcium-binding domain-containing protein [Paragonimus westermani]
MDYENCPRKHEVDAYLREHKLIELFHNLNALLIYHHPENPKRFLLDQLIQLRQAREHAQQPPSLFTQENAQSIFNMLDPCEKNTISFDRYCHALETLGITKYNKKPDGIEENSIEKAVFLKEAAQGLHALASTYRTD